ncbi:MAG: leucine-rich repeat protein [bacterium]
MNINELFKIKNINEEELAILKKVEEYYLNRLIELAKNIEYKEYILVYKLGVLYSENNNHLGALKLVKLAYENGIKEAINTLGKIYFEGKGCSIDIEKAIELYKSGVELGYADCQLSLGILYETGKGIEKDEQEALRLYKLAASQNFALAVREMGMLYQKGRIVKKNGKEAIKWYELAVELGNVSSLNQIGFIYDECLGDECNKKIALEYYIKAAEKGSVVAASNASTLLGDEKLEEIYDLDLAIEYCTKAANKGHYNSHKKLVTLKNKKLKCPVYLVVGTHPYDTPGYDIELDTILPKDSFLKSIDGSTDIKMIPKNFRQLSRSTINFNANVLIVEDGVNDIQMASFENVGTLVYLGTKSFPSIRAFKSMKIKNAIFINAGFLAGSMFLVEGCFHIMKNFEEFNDKENFIKQLKKKSEKINNILMKLFEMNDEVVAKFIVDNIASYEMLNSFTKFNLDSNINFLLLNAINNSDVKEKEKFESKQGRKEDLTIGIDNTTIQDLKMDFGCAIKDNKIVISKYIGNYEDCIIFPADVEGINDYMFKGLIKSNTIKTIIFEEGIKNITIDKVTAIFSKCECLEEMHLPKSLEHIDEQILMSLPDFTKVITKDSIYNSKGNFIYKDTKLVTVVKKSKILNLEIPFGTTDIADNLFYNCKNLTSVSFPKTIQRIGESAFSRCRFRSVTFPHAVDKELTIEKEAFAKSNLFYKFNLPKGLKIIKEHAFSECKAASSFTIPSTVEYIGKAAFDECRSMGKINVPAGVECLENAVFADCTTAHYIEIEEGVKKIGATAFYNCRCVSSISVSSTVESFVSSIDDLYNVSSITVADNNNNFKSIENVLFNKDCTTLLKVAPKRSGTTFIIPDTVVSISVNAFAGCRKLTKIVIPSSVKTIKENTFSENAEYKIYTSLKEKPEGWNIPESFVIWGSEE